jgi:hypothetical protein
MEECLEALEREKDGPGDEVLTAMVRLQLLGDEAHKLLLKDVAAAGAGTDSGHTPSYVFRKSMMLRLESIKDSISSTATSSCESTLPLP